MATLTYEAGNTIRVRATFRDWVPEGSLTLGAIIDPDTVRVSLFTTDHTLINSYLYDSGVVGLQPPIVKTGTGSTANYYYDWTLPDPGNYYIVWDGQVAGEPILVRLKIKTKWDVIS